MPKKDNWSRGYFCALAALLKEQYKPGVSGPDADSLFHQCRTWHKADPEDVQTLVEHGLVTRAEATAAGFNIPTI